MRVPPERPVVGELIPEGYWGSIWDWIRSMTPRGDNVTTRANQSYDGTTIQAIKQPAVASSASGEGGGAEYNGYFKIVDVSDEDGFKVKVIDGAGSGRNFYYINGGGLYIDDYTSEVISATSNILIKHSAPVEAANGNPYAPSSHEVIVQTADIPSSTDDVVYYLIGRAIIANGVMTIQQDHSNAAGNGIPQLLWFNNIC